MSDPLSDVLDLIGVKSSVYFQKDFCAPWGMSISDTGFAQFHILVRGMAVVVHDGRTIQLSTGDIVLFPKGAKHLISDPSQSTHMPGHEVIASMAEGQEPFLAGDTTVCMICGHFEYDFACSHPVLEELPEIIILRANKLPMMDHLFSLVQLIIRETSTKAPGSDVVVRRLSDGLLVTILRTYFESGDKTFGFYKALADDRMLPVLQAIHCNDGSDLDIASLAALAGMSRSSFLHHFKAKVGTSAGSYATRWKLLKARAALTESANSIESIGINAGYNSASAFSRAFQGTFGMTPTDFRNEGRKP